MVATAFAADGLYRVTTATACFGFVVKDAYVDRCAPFGRRQLSGRFVGEVLRTLARWPKTRVEYVGG